MKKHTITIPVTISIESPNGTPLEHVQIRAKRLVAATFEGRGDVFERELPDGWEAWMPGCALSAAPAVETVSEDTRLLDWLWENCRILFWPGDGAYPIEHNRQKNGRMFIEPIALEAIRAAMKAGEQS